MAQVGEPNFRYAGGSGTAVSVAAAATKGPAPAGVTTGAQHGRVRGTLMSKNRGSVSEMVDSLTSVGSGIRRAGATDR